MEMLATNWTIALEGTAICISIGALVLPLLRIARACERIAQVQADALDLLKRDAR